MRTRLVFLALAFLIAPAAAAQDAPLSPPAQLGEFDIMLGSWTGEGIAYMTPDGEAMPWVGNSTVTKVLGGHFIQEDVVVDAGGPTPMVFRTLYHWDAERETFRQHSIGNQSGVNIADCHWTADDVFVSGATMKEGDALVTDVVRTQYKEDHYEFLIMRSVDGAAPFKHVKGKFHRGGKTVTAASAANNQALFPAADVMQDLKGLTGEWVVTGRMKMAPEAPAIEISGKESIRYILGGHALFTEIIGEPSAVMPMEYLGNFYQAWDPARKALVGIYFSNMGEIIVDESVVLDDGTMVGVFAGMYQGRLMSRRNVTKRNADGSWSMTGWTMADDGAPLMGFEGTLSPAKATRAGTR